MIIDSTDISILKEFLNLDGKETTTWEIMKKLYPRGQDKEHMNIKRRLDKMEKYGIFFVNGEPKEYVLISDNVKKQKILFENKKVDCICIFTSGRWNAFQL